MEKLGNIGIEDIPSLTNADKVKTYLPLLEELKKSAMESDYAKSTNKANTVISQLFMLGGDIYYCNDAKAKYGSDQVRIVMKYYKEVVDSSTLSYEEKKAVCSWIADNIFDLDRMTS
jgi:hypothetical protein